MQVERKSQEITWIERFIRIEELLLAYGFSGGLVSNAKATCLLEGNNNEKSLLIPHTLYLSHGRDKKGVIR